MCIRDRCCGTTPAYIAKLASLKTEPYCKPAVSRRAGVCTPTKAVFLDRVRVIGERINPCLLYTSVAGVKKGNFSLQDIHRKTYTQAMFQEYKLTLVLALCAGNSAFGRVAEKHKGQERAGGGHC